MKRSISELETDEEGVNNRSSKKARPNPSQMAVFDNFASIEAFREKLITKLEKKEEYTKLKLFQTIYPETRRQKANKNKPFFDSFSKDLTCFLAWDERRTLINEGCYYRLTPTLNTDNTYVDITGIS